MKNKRFKKEIKKVVKMNKIHKDVIKFMDEDAINLQSLLIKEEVNETLESIKLHQFDEFIDGIADIFVVASYKEFLMSSSEEEFYELVDHQLEWLKSDKNNYGVSYDSFVTYENFIDLINKLKEVNETGSIIRMLKEMVDFVDCITINRKFECNGKTMTVMERAISEVMDSNMTKFTHVDTVSFKDVVKEMEYVVEKYKDRNNIYPVLRNNYVIYMSENGKGKFLKPSTYTPVDLSWCNDLVEIDLLRLNIDVM